MKLNYEKKSSGKTGMALSLLIGLILIRFPFDLFRKIQTIEFHPILILLLGGFSMLLYGYRLEKIDQKVFRGTKKLALQGNPEAQFKLGKYYKNGIGVSKSPILAYMWMHLSGYKPQALKELEEIITQEQIEEALSRASQWKDKKKKVDVL